MRIGYTFVIADMLHYGILQLLAAVAQHCDHLVVGVLTDEAVRHARGEPLSVYAERRAVVEAVRYVDEVVPQDGQDPTDNIKMLRERYPEDEFVFVYGDNWAKVPGGEYLASINAKMVRQKFYDRLSEENITHNRVRSLLPDKSVFETFTMNFNVNGFERFQAEEDRDFCITTKARTLQALKPLLKKFRIEKTFVFTCTEWAEYRQRLIEDIGNRFADDTVVVRSSSLNEDTFANSMAGHFDSVLNVDPADEIDVAHAVDSVIASYSEQSRFSGLDQVLVQRQTCGVQFSGVVFTRDMETNAPYYVINYDDSGSTESVTAGQGGKLIKILRSTDSSYLGASWRKLIEAVREVERIIPGYPLDIEFAMTDSGRPVLFQVRPLVANMGVPEVSSQVVGREVAKARRGWRTVRDEAGYVNKAGLVYSDMIFWNPAELIGHRPSNLAYDLFDTVVMSGAWNRGIALLGYPDLYSNRLMERVLYKPYINANLAFWASLPEGVPDEFRPRLVNVFLDKLKANPHLHDKAEFEIMYSCWDSGVEKRMEELADHGFSQAERRSLTNGLAAFSKRVLGGYEVYHRRLSQQVEELKRMNRRPLMDVCEDVRRDRSMFPIKRLLDKCVELGAVPFSAAARFAFIADSLWRGLEADGVVSKEERELVRNSFETVATDLAADMHATASGSLDIGSFMSRYGHLRAGTYDMLQLRYDQIGGADWLNSARPPRPCPELSTEMIRRVDKALRASPLEVGFEQVMDFTRKFVAAREYFKFVYTRTISNVLEIIRIAGDSLGYSPDELVSLDLSSILSLYSLSPEAIRKRLEWAREEEKSHQGVLLPPLLCSEQDFSILSFPDSSPNFITSHSIQGPVAVLDGVRCQEQEIEGHIVFIENADPGFHWILSCGIAGLVTKYGGAASHMAICCAEFDIPAAIGCGVKYDQLKDCAQIHLDSANRTISRKM